MSVKNECMIRIHQCFHGCKRVSLQAFSPSVLQGVVRFGVQDLEDGQGRF